MSLFRKRKIIYFLHLYKTGGTTINDMLFRNFGSDEVVNLYVPVISTGQSGEIFKIHDELKMTDRIKAVYGHYAYGIHRKNPSLPYTYVCFVREPFDRLISTYFHLKRLDIEWQFNILSKLSNTFTTEADVSDKFPDLHTYLEYDGLQNQQCMFIAGVTPEVIQKDQVYYAKMAIDHIEKDFSFVGIQEDFERSLLRLKKILKLKTLEYSYQNLGINKPREIMNESKLREIVNEKSLADTLIYEYVKKKFHA